MNSTAEITPTGSDVGALRVRLADRNDAELIWELRNHPETRIWLGSDVPIPLDDHRRWYAEALRTGSNVIYLAEIAGALVGYVRFDAAGGKKPDTSFVVEPIWRGRGVGRTMLAMACRQFFQDYPGVDLICTSISKRNAPSYNAFRRCRFVETEDGEKYYYSATRDVFDD